MNTEFFGVGGGEAIYEFISIQTGDFQNEHFYFADFNLLEINQMYRKQVLTTNVYMC